MKDLTRWYQTTIEIQVSEKHIYNYKKSTNI